MLIMAGELKILECVRRFYHDMGIYSHQSNQNRLLNMKNILLLSSLILYSTAALAFFIFKATSISEYGISFCMVISGLSMVVFYEILARKMTKIGEVGDRNLDLPQSARCKADALPLSYIWWSR